MKMKTHNFTLTLAGVHEPSDEIEDALFEAGCDDGSILYDSYVCYVTFYRESEKILGAIISAIHDVESIQYPVNVQRVEPADLVTLPELSERLGIKEQAVKQYIFEEKGPGDFPVPIEGALRDTKIWSFSEVARWLHEIDELNEPYELEKAEVIKQINDALYYRARSGSLEKVSGLISALGNTQADQIIDLFESIEQKEKKKNV